MSNANDEIKRIENSKPSSLALALTLLLSTCSRYNFVSLAPLRRTKSLELTVGMK